MTTTTRPELTTCPAWCKFGEQNPGIEHDWDCQDEHRNPLRIHTIELGTLTPVDSRSPLCDVNVSVTQYETRAHGGSSYSAVQVALSAEEYPHLSAGEARQVAAWLLAAADQVDQVARA